MQKAAQESKFSNYTEVLEKCHTKGIPELRKSIAKFHER
jgi:hypothetical protein